MTTIITLENAVAKLFLHDKTYCEQLSKCYQALADIIFNQRMYGFLQIDKIKATYPETLFPQGLQLMEKSSKQLTLEMKDLTIALIQTIETHFTKTYELNFTSILNSLSFQKELQSLTRLPSIDSIIYNILNQAGHKYFGPFAN